MSAMAPLTLHGRQINLAQYLTSSLLYCSCADAVLDEISLVEVHVGILQAVWLQLVASLEIYWDRAKETRLTRLKLPRMARVLVPRVMAALGTHFTSLRRRFVLVLLCILVGIKCWLCCHVISVVSSCVFDKAQYLCWLPPPALTVYASRCYFHLR